MHTNLKTVSGCATRLTVTVTAPEGADKTLTAYCRCCGDSRQATVEGDTVTFPPLPAGEHLYELRAGGIPVIHGHLISRQSAFPMPSGSTIDHAISATIDGTTVANITVTMTAGPRGPQGEPGRDGDTPGLDVEAYTGDATGRAVFNRAVYAAGIFPGGRLMRLVIPARPNGNPDTPAFLGVFQPGENAAAPVADWNFLGSSSTAEYQVDGTDTTWEFPGIPLDPAKPVALVGMPAADSGYSTDRNVGCLALPRAEGDSVSAMTAGNTTIAYTPQTRISIRQDLAPLFSAHREDSTAHVTAGEHAVLANAAQGALWLPGSTGSVTLAGQQGDGVAISAANNTSRVQVQDSGVTITARRTPQWLEAGDTPAFHDIRTAKDLTATDESIAAALAAKQDTLTPGDGINISGNVISATISAHDLSTYATKEELDNAADMSDTYGSTLAEGASPRWVGWPSSSAMADIAGGNLLYMLAVRIRDAESLPQDAPVHSITVKALLAAGGASNRLVLSKPVSGYNTATSQASKAVPMAGAQCFVSDVLECGDTDEVRDVVLYPDGDWKPTVADIANVSMWAGLSPDGLVAYFGPVSPTGNSFGARFAFPTVGSGDIRQDGTGPWIGIYTYDIMHALLRITTGTPGVRVKDAVSANTARITALEESAGSSGGGGSAAKVWQALFYDQDGAPWSTANELRDNLAQAGLIKAYLGGEYRSSTDGWTSATPNMYPMTLFFSAPVTLEQMEAAGTQLLPLMAATPMLTTD